MHAHKMNSSLMKGTEKFIVILHHLSDEPNPLQLLCLPNQKNKKEALLLKSCTNVMEKKQKSP